MSFPAYDEYKDSGVEWLGDVPSHWTVDRFKRSTVSCRNGIWGSEAQGDENDIKCVRVADFDRERLTTCDDIPTTRNVTESERADRTLSEGNLLLEKSGGGDLQPVGFVVPYDSDEPAVCSNFVAKVELAEGMSPSYWRYSHAAAYSVRLNYRSIKQTSGIQNLDQSQYLNEQAPFPPLAEQRAISSFLDVETSKIDGLVLEQRRLIELLKEKRQAVISHAVTKGLNPNAPMKPSGIPWLGDVPEHWVVQRLKHAIASIEQGWSPQCENDPVQSDDQWGVLKVGCVNYGRFTSEENKALPAMLDPQPELGIREGDLLISRANTIELVGSAAVAERDHHNLMLCDKLYRLRMDWSRLLPRFLCYFLTCEIARKPIELGATGASSSMKNIAQSVILDLWFASPDIDEQKEIIGAIGDRSDAITKLVAEAERAIELLQERRTALISAAATGKIDVRDVSRGAAGNAEKTQ